MIQAAQFRVLGERNPRLEHRHGSRWARMDGRSRCYRTVSRRPTGAPGSAQSAAIASCTNGALLRRGDAAARAATIH